MSRKIINLNVALTFDVGIDSDEEVKEIMNNVVRAVEGEINGMGIAPEESDALTDHIHVSDSLNTENSVEKSFKLFT